MSTNSSENVQKETPIILKHLIKWKPLYELAAVGSMMVVIFFSSISIKQTQKSIDVAINSLKLSNKSFDLQQKEFSLRNRPIVIAVNHRFDGPAGDLTGEQYPRSVKVRWMNISTFIHWDLLRVI